MFKKIKLSALIMVMYLAPLLAIVPAKPADAVFCYQPTYGTLYNAANNCGGVNIPIPPGISYCYNLALDSLVAVILDGSTCISHGPSLLAITNPAVGKWCSNNSDGIVSYAPIDNGCSVLKTKISSPAVAVLPVVTTTPTTGVTSTLGVWCNDRSATGKSYYKDLSTCPPTTSAASTPSGIWCQAIGVGVPVFQSNVTTCPANTAPSGPPIGVADTAAATSTANTDPCVATDTCTIYEENATSEAPTSQILQPVNLDVKCEVDPDPSVVGSGNSIMCKLVEIVNFLSMGVGIVATITVAVSGFQYMASRGDPNKTAQAVNRLVQVGMAIAMYVFGWAILNWLIPGGIL